MKNSPLIMFSSEVVDSEASKIVAQVSFLTKR